ncbi:MAG: MAPEG family protein [Alphaproteobacteria bacterium]|nr:MAPEG family protein [Alphaproteobacteria bacterium]
MQPLSAELYWLTLTAVATAFMWLPYTLQFIGQLGPVGAIVDPNHDAPLEPMWAQRAKRAHANAVENLVIFAPLAIAVHITGAGTEMTALAAMVYFFARIGHFIVYWMGLPVIRTLLFAGGFVCQLVLAAALLA